MDKKEYTIKEILDILNISRATLYNKLDKNRHAFDGHISTRNGKKYISKSALSILQNIDNIQDIHQTTETIKDSLDNELLHILKAQICDLQQDKEKLYKELEIKNKQIEDQNRMLENNQVLLQQSHKKILYLETRDENKKLSSWWKKIFY